MEAQQTRLQSRNVEQNLETKRYIVTVDAICGRGYLVARGEYLNVEVWSDFFDQLLEMGAISPVASAEVAVSPNRFMLR